MARGGTQQSTTVVTEAATAAASATAGTDACAAVTRLPPTLASVAEVNAEALRADDGALALRMPNGGCAVCGYTQQSTAAVEAAQGAAETAALSSDARASAEIVPADEDAAAAVSAEAGTGLAVI